MGSIPVLSQLSSELANLCGVLGLADIRSDLEPLLVPGFSSDSALILKLGDEVSLSPSDLSGEITEGAVLSVVFEADDPEGVRHDQLLLEVIGSGNTLEHLELAKSSSTPGSESGEHPSDGSPEDTGWTPVVDKACPWIGVPPLPQELAKLDSIPEEGARNVNPLTPHNNNSLPYIITSLVTTEQLLSDVRGEPAHQMSLSVNDHLLREHHLWIINIHN
jgi:hypothetical protein